MDFLFEFIFTNIVFYFALLPGLVAYFFQIKQKAFVMYLNLIAVFFYTFVSFLYMDKYAKESFIEVWPEYAIVTVLVGLTFYSLTARK